jgi:hypothetical protein
MSSQGTKTSAKGATAAAMALGHEDRAFSHQLLTAILAFRNGDFAVPQPEAGERDRPSLPGRWKGRQAEAAHDGA